jgi:glycosyltransferase involved in cell wall biosynthesis
MVHGRSDAKSHRDDQPTMSNFGLTNIAVMIPAYNPGMALVGLVEALNRFDFRQIVVINDGSESCSLEVFARLETMQNCKVLHHAVNLGKGRSLKTGLNFCCLNLRDLQGIVTADADGQHLPEDIRKVSEQFLKNSRALIVGARKFARGTPFRSLVGNVVTRYVFRVLIGGTLSDTQSGLRCIPMHMVPGLIRLEGEGYEYEMNMLISAKKGRTRILEETISTIYLENNRSSHFNPFLDSMKIYFLLLRFSFSSLLAASIDFVIFSIVYLLRQDILAAFVLARLVAGGVNFFVNKSLVFHDREAVVLPLVKYFMLFLALGLVSFLSIRSLANIGVNVLAAKILVESFLFLASYTIQRDFIFVAPTLGHEG